MSSDRVRHFLGGSPAGAFVKFVLLSILVGALMVLWGLTPANLLRTLQALFQDVFGAGFDALRNTFQYFLYGAVIVGPIWLLTRLMSRR